jgi:isopenicillin N synthase-like dioxygenase
VLRHASAFIHHMPQLSFTTRVSSVDFAPALRSVQGRRAVGEELLAALSGVGFVLLRNSLLSSSRIDPMLWETKKMFQIDDPSTFRARDGEGNPSRVNGHYQERFSESQPEL